MYSNEAVRAQIRAALARFNDLVSTKNLQVIAEFAPEDEALLIGSDEGEIATGRQELEAFFERVFKREETFSWEWDRIDIWHAGDLAWFFADGRVVLTTAAEERKSPYRITGVLQRQGERWLWRQYHGSEPVAAG
jgi:ketosteroid isomerase-like protein